MTSELPSALLEQAVQQMNTLPGIGRKTAIRLTLNLLRRDAKEVEAFAGSLLRLKQEVHYCRLCHTISDSEVCSICSSHSRDKHTVCVVADIQDVLAIENTGQYNGVYHVLGGVISPMDGIGPGDIEIGSLVERMKTEPVREVIFALPATMEGDTTGFYIHKRLQEVPPRDDGTTIKVSQIARGIAVGNEPEYTDEVTLGRAILNRQPL